MLVLRETIETLGNKKPNPPAPYVPEAVAHPLLKHSPLHMTDR
jgi:hypothetical protein